MSKHFVLSWENICIHRRWWAIWTAHVSHRDVEHLLCNVSSFVVLGWAFQEALSALMLAALLVAVPLAASAASLGSLLYVHGPAEAMALCLQYPGLDFHEFCYYRWRDLRGGLREAAAPDHCRFSELGIPTEKVTAPLRGELADDVPLLVAQYRAYDTWRTQASRGSLGLSGVVSSLAGFGTLRLLHLRVRGVRHPALGLGLLLLLLPPGLELAELSGCGAAVSSTLRLAPGRRQSPGAEADDVDAAGHLAGFACGALAYWCRARSLT